MASRIDYNGSSKVIRRICEIVNNVAKLGTTHDSAFYGDWGQEAYDHSHVTSGNPHNVTLDDLGIADMMNEMRLVLNTIVSTDYWTTHVTDTEYIVDHEGDYLVFVSGSNILAWH